MKHDFDTKEFDIDEFNNNDLSKRKEIHIKLQQRKGKKYLTFIEGLYEINNMNNIEKEKFIDHINKQLKKKFNCGSSIKKPEFIIQLHGDHREEIKKYLIEKKIVSTDQIKIHGF